MCAAKREDQQHKEHVNSHSWATYTPVYLIVKANFDRIGYLT